MNLNTVALSIWAAVLFLQGGAFIWGGPKSTNDTKQKRWQRSRNNNDKCVSPPKTWSFSIFFTGLATTFLVAFDHIWMIKKASLRADGTTLTSLGLA
jgi:hypothetical protein